MVDTNGRWRPCTRSIRLRLGFIRDAPAAKFDRNARKLGACPACGILVSDAEARGVVVASVSRLGRDQVIGGRSVDQQLAAASKADADKRICDSIPLAEQTA